MDQPEDCFLWRMNIAVAKFRPRYEWIRMDQTLAALSTGRLSAGLKVKRGSVEERGALIQSGAVGGPH